MFELMGKEINAILCAQTIPIWTYALLRAHRVTKDKLFPHADSEDTDAQADQIYDETWVNFVGFVMQWPLL